VFAQLGSLLIENDQFDEAEPFLRRAVDEGKVPSAYGDLANVLWDTARPSPPRSRRTARRRWPCSPRRSSCPTLAKSTLDMLLDLHEEDKVEAGHRLLLKAAERTRRTPPCCATSPACTSTATTRRPRAPTSTILALPRRSLDDDAFARRAMLTLEVEDFEDRYDAAIDAVRGDDPRPGQRRQVPARGHRPRPPLLAAPPDARARRPPERGRHAALAHLMDAVRLRPNDAEIRNLLAVILRKLGRPREAVDHLRAVVAINPRDVEPVVASPRACATPTCSTRPARSAPPRCR
jgi:tetratricopeptide (TPR) repeat protein